MLLSQDEFMKSDLSLEEHVAPKAGKSTRRQFSG